MAWFHLVKEVSCALGSEGGLGRLSAGPAHVTRRDVRICAAGGWSPCRWMVRVPTPLHIPGWST